MEHPAPCGETGTDRRGERAAGGTCGSRAFVEKLQALPGRTLLRQKRGPKAKDKQEPNAMSISKLWVAVRPVMSPQRHRDSEQVVIILVFSKTVSLSLSASVAAR